MPNRSSPMPRGKTMTSVGASMVGLEKEWPDVNWGSTERVKPPRTGGLVKCMLVYNAHTAAVTPGLVVTWTAGYWGKRTGAPCGAGAIGAGIVDEYLPSAGAAAGSYYWLVRKGPTNGVVATASISQGKRVVTSGTGKVVEDTATTTSLVATCGQVMTACTTADTTVRIHCNFERF